MVVVLQVPVQGETATPRVLKETNCWKRASLDSNASVTLCQKAAFSDWLAGHPPLIAGPSVLRALYSNFQIAMPHCQLFVCAKRWFGSNLREVWKEAAFISPVPKNKTISSRTSKWCLLKKVRESMTSYVSGSISYTLNDGFASTDRHE
jgi:hypothetical protein